MKNYYHILGLDENASQAEIKEAYRNMQMVCHPDKNPQNKHADSLSKVLNEAYRVLSNEHGKSKYDASLEKEHNSKRETAAEKVRNIKLYIVNFDVSFSLKAENHANLRAIFSKNKLIHGWSAYINTSYLIAVDNNISATDVSKYILSLNNKLTHFVAELNFDNHNGLLNKKAWDWINKLR